MANNYWKSVFAGAWDKTYKPLGWDRKKVAVVLLAIGAIIVAGFQLGWGAMITTATGYLWVAAPVSFAAIILFAWGIIETQARLYADLQTNFQSLSSKFTSKKPNYAAVRRQHTYTIGAASRLWIDRDPNIRGTPDSEAWCDTFVSAIQKGELEFVPQWPRDASLIMHERKRPSFTTKVSREELKRYAASIGEDPPFLRDA